MASKGQKANSRGTGSTSPQKIDDEAVFPRGRKLPTQSPLYWVENKDRLLRQILIRDIEGLTGRRLGIYFAERTSPSRINQGDVDRLYDIVQDLDTEPFDLIVETRGGETDAAEAMISLLMSTKHSFRAIVPNRAKSNGTLLCLAAERLVMGPTSELGPIEPIVLDEIPATALVNFNTNGDRDLDIAKFHATHALEQTKLVAKRALRHKMCSDINRFDDASLVTIIDALCGRVKFPSHGSVIDAEQASDLGLAVTRLDKNDEIWNRVWLLYCMLRHDAELRNLQKIFETKKVSIAVLNGIY